MLMKAGRSPYIIRIGSERIVQYTLSAQGKRGIADCQHGTCYEETLRSRYYIIVYSSLGINPVYYPYLCSC